MKTKKLKKNIKKKTLKKKIKKRYCWMIQIKKAKKVLN